MENRGVEDHWNETQAARFVGVAKSTLQQLCREGAVPYGQVGRKRYFFKSDLVAWLRSQVKRPTRRKARRQ